MQMKEGEILGHECIGIVEKVGSKVTAVKPGDRVVAAFNIACGKCKYCSQKMFTSCEAANNSSVMDKLYGHRIAGVIGYSHVKYQIYQKLTSTMLTPFSLFKL
jgi:Zn-dependent alcohol dehydrogenase